MIPDYIFNKRFQEKFLDPPAVKDFFDDVNLCSHIAGVTGLHKIMAEGIPLGYKILGGCQIIRLFDTKISEFLLFIGGKSEAFPRPLSSSVQEQLAEKLLREKGDIQQKHTDFRFSKGH
ncbi:MAG: hypothetical protein ACK481_06715 [Candidatus Melainabacteria bacterium]